MKPLHYISCVAGSLLWLLAACGSSTGPTPQATAAGAAHAGAATESQTGLTLDARQRDKIGLVTAPAAEASYLAESSGYGIVVGHEAIAVAAAEVATAQATVRQSRAALAREQGLAGTPGALSAETAENTERQAAADSAALTLAERRLTALLGQGAPVNASGSPLLSELATGRVKLIRATFPLGALPASPPKLLRLARLDGSVGTRHWTGDVIWDAPADASIPGRTFFTLLRTSEVGEGERLQVWAATGATLKGATVPASAVIQSNSAYWCYIEKQAGRFTRAAVDTSRPVTGGYFVSEGVAAGTTVVTAGAGLLLARETNPGTEAVE